MNRNDLPASNAVCEVCGKPYRRCNKCIELRNRGIDMWRYHCDCAECYQIYSLVQRDPSTITLEDYEYIKSIELPEDRKPIKEVKDKIDGIKTRFESSLNTNTDRETINNQHNNEPLKEVYKQVKARNKMLQTISKNVK